MTDVLMKKSPQDDSESAAHCENNEQRGLQLRRQMVK